MIAPRPHLIVLYLKWTLMALPILQSSVALAAEMQLGDFEQTRARPLFSITRRPPPKPLESEPVTAPVAAPQSTSQIPPPAIKLIGTVLGPTETTIIVSKSSETKPLRIQVGDDIDGWRVVSIAARGAVIQHDDRSITLTFPTDSEPNKFGNVHR